jgi:arachidonate 15-lipoxygenase
MKPSLPQNDPNKQQRSDYLNRQQQAYQFDYQYLSPLALLKGVPASENFSSAYVGERLVATSELPANMLAADVRSFLDPLDDLQDYEDLLYCRYLKLQKSIKPIAPLPNSAYLEQIQWCFAC